MIDDALREMVQRKIRWFIGQPQTSLTRLAIADELQRTADEWFDSGVLDYRPRFTVTETGPTSLHVVISRDWVAVGSFPVHVS